MMPSSLKRFVALLTVLFALAGCTGGDQPSDQPRERLRAGAFGPGADGLIEPGAKRQEVLGTSNVHNGWSVCPSQARVWVWNHSLSVHPKSVLAWKIVSFATQQQSQYARFLAANWYPTGAFNCRFIGGTRTHSEHAHALAIDVRWTSNPARFNGVLATDFDRFGDADAIRWLSPFLRMGFRWGVGGWCNPLSNGVNACLDLARRMLANEGSRYCPNGRCFHDAMHLEMMRSPASLASFLTLKVGRSGDPVLYMKDRLARAGFDRPEHDFDPNNSYFGNPTKAAVIAFQKAKGLKADGVVGAGTWGKLAA